MCRFCFLLSFPLPRPLTIGRLIAIVTATQGQSIQGQDHRIIGVRGGRILGQDPGHQNIAGDGHETATTVKWRDQENGDKKKTQNGII